MGRALAGLALVDAFGDGVVDQGMHAALGAVGLEDLVGAWASHGALLLGCSGLEDKDQALYLVRGSLGHANMLSRLCANKNFFVLGGRGTGSSLTRKPQGTWHANTS